MKVIVLLLSALAAVSAFAPSVAPRTSSSALNAEPALEQSRKAFLAFVASSLVGAAAANAMDQEYVSDPTEVWETGSPDAKVEALRKARYTNARTQMTSNFAPIKRLTLERKSPVTRLDINSPGFEAYKKTYPGLFKK
jgi:hypothetical protein